MTALGTICGVLILLAAIMAGVYGLVIAIVVGILPLWELVYPVAYLHIEPASASWLYSVVADVVLISILVPLWTGLCAGVAFLGAVIAGISN